MYCCYKLLEIISNVSILHSCSVVFQSKTEQSSSRPAVPGQTIWEVLQMNPGHCYPSIIHQIFWCILSRMSIFKALKESLPKLISTYILHIQISCFLILGLIGEWQKWRPLILESWWVNYMINDDDSWKRLSLTPSSIDHQGCSWGTHINNEDAKCHCWPEKLDHTLGLYPVHITIYVLLLI